jgi:hypothetical protein
VLCNTRKHGNRDLSGFGAASNAANFIIELHLKSTITAAAPIRAGQGTARAAASNRAGQGRARAAAYFFPGKTKEKPSKGKKTRTTHQLTKGRTTFMRFELLMNEACSEGLLAPRD